MFDNVDLLNLFGLAFQVGGVLSGVYSVRQIIFPKPRVFQSSLDSPVTLSDDQPTDSKTKKPVEGLTVVNHRQAVAGIGAIVIGLCLQIAAIFVSQLG